MGTGKWEKRGLGGGGGGKRCGGCDMVGVGSGTLCLMWVISEKNHICRVGKVPLLGRGVTPRGGVRSFCEAAVWMVGWWVLSINGEVCGG